MVISTQTICRQIAGELFECVWPFCGVGALRVKTWQWFVEMQMDILISTRIVNVKVARMVLANKTEREAVLAFAVANILIICNSQFMKCANHLIMLSASGYNLAGIYLFKVKNRNTRARCEICSKLTIKTPERRWCRFGVSIFNFEHIPHLVLVFLFLTLSR